MKILPVIAIHKRQELTVFTVKRLKRQTVPIMSPILIGSDDTDYQTAKMLDAKYFQKPNMPLGAKWQYGIQWAREFNPDAILILGSDDWLTDNWCQVMGDYIRDGYDLVGKNIIHFFDVPTKRLLKWNGDRHPHRGSEPIGAGRLISKRILDKLDWVLFDPIRVSLDLNSFKRMKAADPDLRIRLANDADTWAVDIKHPDFGNINSIKLIQEHNISELVETGTDWLYSKFPDAKEFLEQKKEGAEL